jgi:hypothetical protein
LKRRFGFGLTGRERSLGQRVLIAFTVSASLALLLLIVLIIGGKAVRAGIVLGPVVGVTLGTLLGGLLVRRRRRD